VSDEDTSITGESAVAGARLLTLRTGLKLEIKGMTRHGRSCYSIIKSEFKLKGSKIRVYEQFTDILNGMMPGMNLPRDGYK
jgi:hypothetical protein